MKKLLSILILSFALASFTQAQVVVATMKASLTSTVDSVRCVGTTPNYLYISPNGDYSTAVYQATVRRVSTAIGGSIFLQGSIDGTNWYTATNVAGDTMTVADAATQALKTVVGPTYGNPWKSYRLKFTGASSDTMYVKARVCYR